VLLALAAARHAYGSWRNREKEELCHDDVDLAMAGEVVGG
jgi:hypothetical protein